MDHYSTSGRPVNVIVTTRHRIDVAYAVRLTGMPWADAEQLITQECRSRTVELSPTDTRRLFDCTGGVPLAIVWSIAQVGFGYPLETFHAALLHTIAGRSPSRPHR